jgi:hypothetical protein
MERVERRREMMEQRDEQRRQVMAETARHKKLEHDAKMREKEERLSSARESLRLITEHTMM